MRVFAWTLIILSLTASIGSGVYFIKKEAKLEEQNKNLTAEINRLNIQVKALNSYIKRVEKITRKHNTLRKRIYNEKGNMVNFNSIFGK